MTRATLILLLVCLWSLPGASHAIAPAPDATWAANVGVSGAQQYADSRCTTDPNIIFCEPFNYPENFTISLSNAGCKSTPQNCEARWKNPALVTCSDSGLSGSCNVLTATGQSIVPSYPFGVGGRYILPASNFPPKPTGHLPSGAQADHVWVANWDSVFGTTDSGSTMGLLRIVGGNYQNGEAPLTDWYMGFHYYVTSNYVWPGDPKTHIYNFSGGLSCGGIPGYFDNKILYFFEPNIFTSAGGPTSAPYDAGMATVCGQWDNVNNARFADGIAMRYGDIGDNFKIFPLCSSCQVESPFFNYGPYQSLTFRNPGDTPLLRRIFRFDTGRWYWLVMRYKLASGPGVADGVVEVWVNDTKIYSESTLKTCGTAYNGGEPQTHNSGTCTGLGLLNILAYHNGNDPTAWNGQQVIDDLVVSKAYISAPTGAASNPKKFSPQLDLRRAGGMLLFVSALLAAVILSISNGGLSRPRRTA